VPRDDAALVEIIRNHTGVLGIRWPKARRKKKVEDGAAPKLTTKEAKAAEARRGQKVGHGGYRSPRHPAQFKTRAFN